METPAMYSVLVTGQVKAQIGGTFTVPRDRYLEYTAEPIVSQLRTLSRDAIECLKSWPCLLMNEGRSDEVAYVVRIAEISATGGNIKLAAVPLAADQPLINDILWKLRVELDIEQFEFSRHHLAVKSRDLLGVLARAGHGFQAGEIARFTSKPLPVPSRGSLVAAIDGIAEWSHDDIDRFLLESGISGLEAPRALGGRKNRAKAIVQFAITNPSATTAENELLSALIVRRAQKAAVTSGPNPPFGSGIEVGTPVPKAPESQLPTGDSPNRVFVVHGQNEVARKDLVAFLLTLGLEAIVLHEQPNMGRHLLTKFIDEAELVTFAVVLMTDDDVGSTKGGMPAPRARQNVILELGYFLSHLGQARVCAIITPGLETPSDFDGIVYIRMDNQGAWKYELMRELRAAKMPVGGIPELGSEQIP